MSGGGTHPPGWYPDPQGQPLWRWFDGTAWTEHVSDGQQAASGQGAAAGAAAQPSEVGYVGPAAQPGAQVPQPPPSVWDQQVLLYAEERGGNVLGAPFEISIPDGPVLATARSEQQSRGAWSTNLRDVVTEVRGVDGDLLFAFLDPGGIRDKPNPVLDPRGQELGAVRDAPGLRAHAYELVVAGRPFARVQPASMLDSSRFPVTAGDGTVLAVVSRRTERRGQRDDWLLERSVPLDRASTAVLLATPLQLNASIDRARAQR